MSKTDEIKKTPISVFVTGCIASVFIAIGAFFKMMHWPGASQAYIISSISFILLYMPLWLIYEFKKEKWLSTLYQFVILLLTGLTSFFKTMHWPGAGILFNLWMGTLLYIVLPVSIYQLFRSGKRPLSSFHTIVTFFLIGSMLIGGINGAKSGMVSLSKTYSKNTEKITESFRKTSHRNEKLYQAFEATESLKGSEYFRRAEKLKSLSDSIQEYFRNFKNNVIAASENISLNKADSINYSEIRDPLSTYWTTALIWGEDEFKPIDDKFSGLELMRKINSYRDSALNLITSENKEFIKEGINLETEPSTDEFGEPIHWVAATFRFTTVPQFMQIIENLKYQAKLLESQVLADLLNSAKNSSGELSDKIAIEGKKMEVEKTMNEIENLKAYRQLSQDYLNSKNRELNAQNQTISAFVIGLLLCFVMVFFIIRSNLIRKKINKELQEQKHLIEEKNKEITDSITYAKRLQEAILPPESFLQMHLPGYFVLYQPKDIVAGDFYWAEKINDLFFIAAADSTGHGVPGAMVSVVCSNALNRSVKEFNITDTGKLLDKTRELVIETFEKSTSEVKDGMDISLLCIDNKNKKIFWSGANNPLWYISNNELKEIKANKQPIGKSDHVTVFTTHEMDYTPGTTFYLFTDGIADQFGGPKGKKFKYKQLNEVLLKNSTLPLEKQKQGIANVFNEWKGDLEQVDDVCLIAIRI